MGGYFWAIAEPLGGILLLSIAFSLAVRTPPMGTSFMLFYATGVVPYSMFNTMSKGVAGAIASNKGLLTYPVVSTLDAVLAKFVLNFLTIFVVAIVLFTGIILIGDVDVNLDLGSAAGAFVLAALLGLGIGTLNCVLNGFFLDLEEHLVGADPAAVPPVGGLLHLSRACRRSFRSICGTIRWCM